MCMEVLGLTFYELLWYFAIYSFLGWCMEVVFCTVRTGKLVNRGFLNGPVCPIYGFGMVIVLAVLGRFSDTISRCFSSAAWRLQARWNWPAAGRSNVFSTRRGGITRISR